MSRYCDSLEHTTLPSFVRIPWRLAWVGVWHGLTQAWLVPKQGPTMPGSVSLPEDLTRRRRRLRIVVAVIPPRHIEDPNIRCAFMAKCILAHIGSMLAAAGVAAVS